MCRDVGSNTELCWSTVSSESVKRRVNRWSSAVVGLCADVKTAMSSPVLIAMVLTLSVAICSNSAAVDTGGDDGNSTDVVAGRSTRVPTSGHHSETAVTDGNSTDVSATGAWTTQPDEVQSLSPSSRISDVRVPWFRAVSPILIALTTVGNPLSIVTLQNRLFRFDIVISNFCLL